MNNEGIKFMNMGEKGMELEKQIKIGNKALQAGLLITIAVGAAMVVLPTLTIQFFGLLIFQNASAMLDWPPQAQHYVKLAHAVMGSVMMGWAVLMLYVTTPQKKHNQNWVVKPLSISLAVWYIPDTIASLFYGFWQNAVFNTGFLIMLMLPLYLLRARKTKTNSLTGAP